MQLLKEYFKRLVEEEKFRTLPGDPMDFLNYLVRYEPELEDMEEEQVDLLLDVLEGIDAYIKDHGTEGTTKAEKALNVSFSALFSRYRYRPDPNIDAEDLEPAGEEVYENLIVRYE